MPIYNTPVKLVQFKKQTLRVPERRAYLAQQGDAARTLLGEEATGLQDAKDGLFYTDKSGKFHPIGISDPEYIMPFAKADCLYLRDKNNALRQIGLEEREGEFHLRVSAPLQDVAPKSPSLWTYIKSIFVRSAREEIQAYKEAKAFHENFRQLAGSERYHIDPKPDMTAIRPEEAPAKAPEVQKPAARQAEAKQAEPLNPSKMTAERFEEHLREVMETGAKSPDKAILDRPNGHTPDQYYEAVAQVLEGHVAKNMLYAAVPLEEEQKTRFLDAQKKEYTSLAAGLRDFVRTKIDGELVNRFLESRNQVDSIRLRNLTLELEKTGVPEYLEQVKAQNAAAKAQQPQPDQPQQQQLQPPVAKPPVNSL